MPFTEEIEERRVQREKENEDIIRRKHDMADKQKAKTLAEFDRMAKTASEQHNKVLQASDESLKERIRRADEDKARTLAAYDNIARKEKSTTVTKTEEIPGRCRLCCHGYINGEGSCDVTYSHISMRDLLLGIRR